VMVVLRLEILSDGELGRVVIDQSSGRDAIDDAAIAYVRACRWQPGTRNGTPELMWIRYGVRLDG
jgi:TonB family protein